MVGKCRPVPTSVRLDPELKAELEKAAAADGRSLSNLIERILREWISTKPQPRRGRAGKLSPQSEPPDITIIAVEAKDGKPTGRNKSYKMTKEGLTPLPPADDD